MIIAPHILAAAQDAVAAVVAVIVQAAVAAVAVIKGL